MPPDATPALFDQLATLTTESVNERTRGLDEASVLDALRMIHDEDRRAVEAVTPELPYVAQAVEIVVDALGRGGRLVYVGAGTSGRLGVLDAAECPPTFGTNPETIQGLIAGGPAAMFRAQEGAEDSPEGGARDVEARGVGAHDVVVGIAASGTTPYVRGAVERARSLGARTAVVACSPPPAATLAAADVAIVAVTGPEVLTGSTRLKAGTATKMILNMVTTGAMIRLGKAYGNLMVDLRATNAKLVDRSERIVMEVCAVDRAESRALLAAGGGRVKTAIVMQKLGAEREAAERALDAAGGVIRRVVPGGPPPVRAQGRAQVPAPASAAGPNVGA